tara:strand:- start:3633 stop:3833 length:201 start_codon:yes stop_codon:yes gene_type:complete
MTAPLAPTGPRTDAQILHDYWAAHAQFGPFDVSPELAVKMARAGAVNRDDYERILEERIVEMEGRA